MVGLIAGAAACNKRHRRRSTRRATRNCGYKLAFFGALTGPAANLGVNIEQGFELAVKQYNEQEGRELRRGREVRLAG